MRFSVCDCGDGFFVFDRLRGVLLTYHPDYDNASAAQAECDRLNEWDAQA
jgi:hypothetical protein